MNNLLATWISNWECPLSCPYCINRLNGITKEQVSGSPDPIDWERWTQIWDRYAPEVLIISGGEPLWVPNMVDLLGSINHKTQVFIITTLINDVAPIIERISPRRSLTFLASYHLGQNSDVCLDRAQQLKDNGFRTQINFVAYAKNLHHFPALKKECEERGFHLEVGPYLDFVNPTNYTADEQRLLMDITPDRRHHFIHDTPTDQPGPRWCSAGHNTIFVLPNGDTFRCGAKAVINPEKEVIGNILTDDNVLSDVPMLLCAYCKCCPGDDDSTTQKLVPCVEGG
jgi:MoaA/NifB/PqqE/SkfB family radical SAM enzyme